MKKDTLKILLIALFASTLFLDSCKLPDDDDWNRLFKPKFGSDFITPLAHDEITILDILNQSDDTLIKSGTDSLLYIVFRDTLFVQELDSLMDVKDITQAFPSLIDKSTLPNGLDAISLPPPVSQIVTFDTFQPISFNLADKNALDGNAKPQLKELKVIGGQMIMSVNNQFNEPLSSLIVTLSSVIQSNGDTLKFPFSSIPKNSTVSIPIDLTGSTFNLGGKNGDSVNYIYGKVELATTLNTDELTDDIRIDVNLDLTGLVLSRIEGNFGSDTSSHEEIVDVFTDTSLFSNISGNIVLNSTEMKLELEYTAGIPITMNLQAESVNIMNGNEVKLLNTTTNTDPQFNILKASEAGGVPINNPANNQVITNENYNLSKFISNLPKTIKTKMEVIVPKSTDTTQFVYNTSIIRGILDVYVPLDIGFDNLQYRDTMGFSITKNLDIPQNSNKEDLIKIGPKSMLKAKIVNGLPINLIMDVIALDSITLAPIDTIISNQLIYAASTNSSGVVTSKYQTILSIPITQENFNNLKKSKNINFIVRMDSDSNGSGVKTSKIYSNQTLEFTLVGAISVYGKP